MDFNLKKQVRNFFPEILFGVITGFLLIRMVRLSVESASDFEVYWYAIHAWVSGHSPYVQYSPVYPGLVFKYPPWILPLFLPFADLSLSVSKWVWTFAQIGAIFYTMTWLVRQGVHRRCVMGVGLAFWWMWLAHTYFGQITVFLMALAVGSCGRSRSAPTEAKSAMIAYLFTSKVFSMISLLGLLPQLLTFRAIGVGIGILGLSHLVLLLSYPGISVDAMWPLIKSLYSQWVAAATSGGSELGALIVRGAQNHGLVAALLRIFQVPATAVKYDIGLALILALGFSSVWYRYSRNLLWIERWAGWLAIGVITHPLAWHHSFTMAFPLCVFSLHRAIQSRHKGLILASGLGICCIGIFIPQVIGVSTVVPLEYVGSKSWGVVMCAVSLILSGRYMALGCDLPPLMQPTAELVPRKS